jgi:hypothetical protein
MREGSRLLLHRPRGDEVEDAVETGETTETTETTETAETGETAIKGLVLQERREYGRSTVDYFIKRV